jgi:hypothetical protein
MGAAISEATYRRRGGTAMKLNLLQDLLTLNQAFEQVLRGLERMEQVPLFHRKELRYMRAEVESTRVHANREFFEQFDQIVEKDALWAYRFRRIYDGKAEDPFDLYLEIKEREEKRRKKGLPPRVILLSGGDKDDETPFAGRGTQKRKQAISGPPNPVKQQKPTLRRSQMRKTPIRKEPAKP